MIRIMTEAKADFDRFIDLCAEVTAKKFQRYTNPETLEADLERYRAYYQRKIDKFNQVKDKASPPFNDITYWYKMLKNADAERQGLNVVETFESYIDGIGNNAESKKEFREIFPSSLVRKFEQAKSKLPIKQQLYYTWVYEYKTASPEGREQLVQKLRKLLIDVVGLSVEERKEIDEGTELEYSGEGWKIYRITNYPAAEYYGQGTGWCISGNYPGHENRGKKHFDDYIRGTEPYGYFFALCDDGKKYCFYVRDGAVPEIVIWNGTDGADDCKARLPIDFPEEYIELFDERYDARLKTEKAIETEEDWRELLTEYFEQNGPAINWLFGKSNPNRLDLRALVDAYVEYKGATDEELIAYDVKMDLLYNPGDYLIHLDQLTKYEREHKPDGEFANMSYFAFSRYPVSVQRKMLENSVDELIAAYQEDSNTFYDYIKSTAIATGVSTAWFFSKQVLAFDMFISETLTNCIILSGQGKQACNLIQEMG